MQIEDRYEERTSDLISKIRALREAADREMNRFTCRADYEVRHVADRESKPVPVPLEMVAPSPADRPVQMPAPGSVIQTPTAATKRADTDEEDV
jgi:hypothetical protein